MTGDFLKIAVIGTGYVGLVAGVCLADLGNDVVCIDNNIEKIKLLQKGGVPIYEPGLEKLLKKNVKKDKIVFSSDLNKAVKSSKVIFIAVGTPQGGDGRADLKYVKEVAKEIGKALNGEKVIVNKSTVPVGTGKMVEDIVKKYYKGKFHVVSNPEFLREGSAIKDFLIPDRVVIGARNKTAANIMKKIYAPLKAKVLVTNVESAELIKYGSNALLATKISFINEIARLCDKVDADVETVSEGMGLDSRIGPYFLNPGAGYGGSCFPKDVQALIWIGKKHGYDFQILKAVENVNENQKRLMVKKTEKLLRKVKGKKIGILGLAFKPNTDDMREASAIVIIKELQKKGAKIKAFDPVAMNEAKHHLKNVEFVSSAYDAISDCDAMLVVTEWPQFKKMNLKKVKKLLRKPIIVDGRNLFERKKVEKMGFKYSGIGK